MSISPLDSNSDLEYKEIEETNRPGQIDPNNPHATKEKQTDLLAQLVFQNQQQESTKKFVANHGKIGVGGSASSDSNGNSNVSVGVGVENKSGDVSYGGRASVEHNTDSQGNQQTGGKIEGHLEYDF